MRTMGGIANSFVLGSSVEELHTLEPISHVDITRRISVIISWYISSGETCCEKLNYALIYAVARPTRRSVNSKVQPLPCHSSYRCCMRKCPGNAYQLAA